MVRTQTIAISSSLQSAVYDIIFNLAGDNSQIGVAKQITVSADGSSLLTIESALIPNSGATSFQLTSLAFNAGTNCQILNLDHTTSFEIIGIPDNSSSTVSDPNYCVGTTGYIELYNSLYEMNYQLRNDVGDVPVGLPQIGNGGTINFPVTALTSTNYNVFITATKINGSCEGIELLDKSQLTIIQNSRYFTPRYNR